MREHPLTGEIPPSPKLYETWNEVFREELALVDKRQASGPVPSRNGLIGIAFSGGGIRSATFGLGVLEGLKKLDLLKKIDYLSTVSGGGYIGAWLSANCKRAADREDIDWLNPVADWSESVSYLRRYSNYLAPVVGFFSADTWSMATIWLRNTLLIQITVILAIAIALLIPRPLSTLFESWPLVGNWRWTTIILFITGIAGIAANQRRVVHSGTVTVGARHASKWAFGLVTAVICLAVATGWGIHFKFDPFGKGQVNYSVAGPIALMLVVAGFSLLPVSAKLVSLVPPFRSWSEINYTQGWVQWLVVLPMMATGFLVAAILWEQSQPNSGELAGFDTFSGFFLNAWKFWPFPLSVVFVSLWLLAFCSVRGWVGRMIALLAPVVSIVVLHALLCAIMLLLHHWAGEEPSGNWLAYVWTPPLVLYAFALTVVILIGMLGRQSSEGVREWWSRFGAWLGIYGFVWMVINVAATFGPQWTAGLLDKETWSKLTIGGWVGTTIAGLFSGNAASTGGKNDKGITATVLDVIAKVAPFVFIAGLLLATSTVLHLIILNVSGLTWSGFAQLWYQHWCLMSNANAGVAVYLLAGFTLVFLLFLWRVDINEFSLNAFYRSRLVRCYLGATRPAKERNPQNFTGFDDHDDVPIAQLIESADPTKTPPGPFHIVNCALNLGGSSDLALHTRHSAIFTLTPLRCGSRYDSRDQKGNAEEIGYMLTSSFGGKDGQPTLGQAISVSGAAASPNMGYHTSPVVAFLMTLFNVRLGWWFPKPSRKGTKRPGPNFGLRYLVGELFGGANDKSAYLSISDGGHFENLAAYELVKRRCRVVIISDAECDANLQFEGLGTLIRMCEVDFGAIIDINVGSIRPAGDSTWSTSRCAVGTIHYADRSEGTLIYLKASMTGHEDTNVLQYKAAHPTFPHESTGNQFYGEDQFESYRTLGRDIAVKAFEPVEGNPDLTSASKILYDIWSPTLHNVAQFTQHTTRLMEIWAELGGEPDFRSLDSGLFKAWPKSPPERFRSEFYLCNEMIQLMENVYLDLRLDETWNHPDNKGWRALFENWAKSPAIQAAWNVSSATYGLRFRYFCYRRLGLPLR